MVERIFLVGLMGSGKSTLGLKLALKLDWEFLDLDVIIEDEAGMSIREMFDEYGESYFRELEEETLSHTMSQEQVVLACGGGIVLSADNRQLLEDEAVVWLDIPPASAAPRINGDQGRPLLAGSENATDILSELLRIRRRYYEEVATLKVEIGDQSEDDLVEQIIRDLGVSTA